MTQESLSTAASPHSQMGSWSSSADRAESFLSARQSIEAPVEDLPLSSNPSHNAVLDEESADIVDCCQYEEDDLLPPLLPDRSSTVPPAHPAKPTIFESTLASSSTQIPSSTSSNIRMRWKQLREDTSTRLRRLAKSAKESFSHNTIATLSNTPALPRDNYRRASNSSPQFGVDLKQVHLIAGIPLVVADTTDYLTTKCLDVVGLFRVPGSTSEVRRLREMYNSGFPVDLFGCDSDSVVVPGTNSNSNCPGDNGVNADGGESMLEPIFKTPHSVAALLKLFLRELPEPLLTFDLYDCFIAADSVPIPEGRRESIKRVLKMLPQLNLRLLMHLVIFLRAVQQQSAVNKMNAANLAMVFAPNLLRPRSNDLSVIVSDSPHAVHILETLIMDFDYLFDDVEFENDSDWCQSIIINSNCDKRSGLVFE